MDLEDAHLDGREQAGQPVDEEIGLSVDLDAAQDVGRSRVGVLGFVLALTWPAALLATVVLLAAYLADERLERPRGPLRKKAGVP